MNYIIKKAVDVINHAVLLALPIICREADANITNKTVSLTDQCSKCIPPQRYQLMLTCTQWKLCRRQYANWLLRTRLQFHGVIANYGSYLEIQLDGRCVTNIVKSDEWFWAILEKTSCHNKSRIFLGHILNPTTNQTVGKIICP
jgi:hypothetical protein